MAVPGLSQTTINDTFRDLANQGFSAGRIQEIANEHQVTPYELQLANQAHMAYGGGDVGFGPPTPVYGAAGASGPQLKGYERAAYLDPLFESIDAQGKQQWGQSIAPGIRYGQMAAGGFGDTRQGIAEGVAAGNLQTGMAGLKAQAAQQDYALQTGQNLQQYGMELQNQLGNRQATQAYNLGLGQLALGNTTALNNLYTTSRGQDMQALALGSSLYSQGNAGYLGQGQDVANIGNTLQQAPWSVLNNASGVFSGYTGLGTTTTGQQQGSTLGSVAGGALAGAQIGKMFGNLGFGASSVYNGRGVNTANLPDYNTTASWEP